jgi:hypothetical protein
MKANELRLGNLFQERNSKEIIEVIGLEKNRIIFSGMLLDNWQAEPIPLTEEWQKKLGAKNEGFYNFLDFKVDKQKFRISFYGNKMVSIANILTLTLTKEIGPVTVFNFPVDAAVEYVHELQNLYFALTGTELSYENP